MQPKYAGIANCYFNKTDYDTFVIACQNTNKHVKTYALFTTNSAG